MTVRQFPQPGDVVATRAQDRDHADLHGAVLVARRDEPLQSEATDLSNVIPFARPRRHAVAAPFPLPAVAADERPAPHAAKFGVGRSVALVVGSLALHSALLAMFWHQPKPMASIGIEVMNVEIVLGATTAAGLAPTPGEQEAPPTNPGESLEHEPVTEQSRATTVMPQEVPVAAQETAPEVKPQETAPEVEIVDPKPQEQQPVAAVAETPATEQPTEKTEQPRPQVQAVQKAPERKRIEAPTDKKAAQKKDRAVAQQTNPAKGVGIGRSDKSRNYDGIVRAHLARHQQPLRGATGSGVAMVHFLIDGRGRVTSARLVSSSGIAAFDREAVAMVRRASPFPASQDGKSHDYTIPVRFKPQ